MQKAAHNFMPSPNARSRRRCVACGDGLPPRHRRYCDTACRQNLLASLNRRTGLLRALNTRYATFYFTDFIIVMDLLPYGMEQIYSYMLPRSPGKKPVEDFCELSNILGSVWWNEKNRTKKRYLASRLVLNRADKPEVSKEAVIPLELTVPAVRASSLVTLKLRAADLTPANMEASIKKAYRQQVKKHHPDIGGKAQTFLKIQEAYEKMIQWAKHPTYTSRRGFPDKWLYEGATNRWVRPAPAPKATK